MTYSYHCALNGISSPKKVKYSTDSKLPIDTSTLVKKTATYSNSTTTNINLINVKIPKITNKVKKHKLKQKKDPKTNFISTILANASNNINFPKGTLISSAKTDTILIDDYNSSNKPMNIQSNTFELNDFTEQKINLVTKHSSTKQNKDVYYLKTFDKLHYKTIQNNDLTKNKNTKIKLKLKLKSILCFYQYNFNNNHLLLPNKRFYFTNVFDNKIFIDKMRYKTIFNENNYNLYKSYLLRKYNTFDEQNNPLANRVKFENYKSTRKLIQKHIYKKKSYYNTIKFKQLEKKL